MLIVSVRGLMMKVFTAALLAFAILASCKAETQVRQTEQRPTNAETAALQPGDPLSPLEKDGSAKSSFGPGVVLRLNAIVAESKNAIDKFDKLIPDVRKAVDAAKGTAPASPARQQAEKAMAQLAQLHEATKVAKKKLAVEGQALVDSRKYYDGVIFSGMARFVERVEDELGDEIKLLSDKLKA